MGLKLRLNLFDAVDAPDVFGALASFYAERGAALVDERERHYRYDLYRRGRRYSVLDWDGGWEWEVRREAQLFVSKRLNTLGLLVFVDDGDYWGYELFRNGQVLDRFVQVPDWAEDWFDEPAPGNVQVLAHTLGLAESDLAPYLVQDPLDADEVTREKLNVLARPGDEFTRFDECAVLDFLRALGVDVELRESYVRIRSELWRSFRPHFG